MANCCRLVSSRPGYADLCHRTLAPLSYPPHVIALGALYAASLLSSSNSAPHANPSGVIATLGASGHWESEYSATVDSVDGTYLAATQLISRSCAHFTRSLYNDHDHASSRPIAATVLPVSRVSARTTECQKFSTISGTFQCRNDCFPSTIVLDRTYADGTQDSSQR